jgi:hypothetical protein
VLSLGIKPAISTAIRALTLASNPNDNTLTLKQRHVIETIFLDGLDNNEVLIPPPKGILDLTLSPYKDDSRPTKELLDIAYLNDKIANCAFKAIDSYKTRLFK